MCARCATFWTKFINEDDDGRQMTDRCRSSVVCRLFRLFLQKINAKTGDSFVSKTLKVGVIGVGGISKTHMPGWAASQHAEVVAGSDINEAVLADWGKTNGVTKLVKDPADLFRDKDIDII